MHQNPRHLRIILRYLQVRRKQFQLLNFPLLVEYLNAFHPPRLSRTVQLAQIAQRSLAGTAGGPYRLHQRPVGVPLTVLASLMRPQKHPWLSLPSARGCRKRVGLHYIAFSNLWTENTRLVTM